MERWPFSHLISLLKYWQEWPPEHELLRGFVGYKPPKDGERKTIQSSSAVKKAHEVFGAAVDRNALPAWLQQEHEKRKAAANG